MTPCKHLNCRAMLESRNRSGLCKWHYGLSRRNVERNCAVCGAIIRKDNASGYCRQHVPSRKPALPELIPAERMDDYLFLRQVRRLRVSVAREIILSGEPIDRTSKEKCAGSKSSTKAIVEYVAWRLGTTRREILSEARYKHNIEARACVMQIMHARNWSTPAIGRHIGRDHSTIISGLRNWPLYVQRNPKLAWVVDAVAGLPVIEFPVPAFARAA